MADRERREPGNLPMFEVEEFPLGAPVRRVEGGLMVLDEYRCPRSGCGKTFYVDAGELVESRRDAGFHGAACPHCSRVSEVPGTRAGEQQGLGV